LPSCFLLWLVSRRVQAQDFAAKIVRRIDSEKLARIISPERDE
jgi:uncharacterized membrane protein